MVAGQLKCWRQLQRCLERRLGLEEVEKSAIAEVEATFTVVNLERLFRLRVVQLSLQFKGVVGFACKTCIDYRRYN